MSARIKIKDKKEDRALRYSVITFSLQLVSFLI